MKKILTLLSAIILLVNHSFAQTADEGSILTKDEATGEYFYEKVKMVDSVSKEELFKRAKMWLISHVKTVDNNNSFDDKDYSIVNTAIIKIDATHHTLGWNLNEGSFNFKVTLFLKDGKYKIRVDNISIYTLIDAVPHNLTYSDKDFRDAKGGKYIKSQVDEKIKEFVKNLNKAIKNKDTSKDF